MLIIASVFVQFLVGVTLKFQVDVIYKILFFAIPMPQSCRNDSVFWTIVLTKGKALGSKTASRK